MSPKPISKAAKSLAAKKAVKLAAKVAESTQLDTDTLGVALETSTLASELISLSVTEAQPGFGPVVTVTSQQSRFHIDTITTLSKEVSTCLIIFSFREANHYHYLMSLR